MLPVSGRTLVVSLRLRYSASQRQHQAYYNVEHPTDASIHNFGGAFVSVSRLGVTYSVATRATGAEAISLSVLKDLAGGVGIGGADRDGRSWNMYFWAGQYIGDICDGCEMNGNSGLRCI